MKQNSFIKGAIIASAGFITVKIIGVLYVIPFNAIIGEDGGALYSFGYNIYSIFLTIATAGVPFAMAKIIGEYNSLGYENAKNNAYKIGRNILTIVSVIAFLIMFTFADVFAKIMVGEDAVTIPIEDIAFVIRCVSTAVLVIPFLSVTKGYLQGHKFISSISASQIIEQILRVSVILVGTYLMMIVFDLGLKLTIGVAMLGATIGGLGALIYLKRKLSKNKEVFLCEERIDDSHITTKVISKKIIKYAIPFIITAISVDLYVLIDMIFVVRTMGDILHYDPEVTTSITAVYSIWAPKLLLIVTSFSAGISMSLLPNIVNSYARGDVEEICRKHNRALQLIISFILPLTIFISIFSDEIWMLFYGESEYGPEILQFYIFIALVNAFFVLASDMAQGMNKFKLVYTLVGVGMGLKLVLDIPLMILMDYLGVDVVFGAVTATLISMSLAFLIGVTNFIKKEQFKYRETVKLLPRIITGIVLFVITALLVKEYIDFGLESRLMQIVYLAFYGIVTFGIYGLFSYFTGTLKELLGEIKIPFLNRKK